MFKVKVINPKIIKALIRRMPEQAEKARKRFPKLEKWASGQDYPTYNQLVKLSEIFDIPYGYFFLEKLPRRRRAVDCCKPETFNQKEDEQ